MTEYRVYKVTDEQGQPYVMTFVSKVDASGAKAAVRAAVPKPDEGTQYAAIPWRNHTLLRPKTKPAQVSWS